MKTSDIHADLTVSHDRGKGFSFACSGQGVDRDGTVTVQGDQPVRIHFRLSPGPGVASVRFAGHAGGIWVGERGSACPGGGPPTGRESDEFDDKQPGASGANLSIRDRKTAQGDGSYPYVLAFDATPEGGEPTTGFFDPMIINRR